MRFHPTADLLLVDSIENSSVFPYARAGARVQEARAAVAPREEQVPTKLAESLPDKVRLF